MAFDSKPGDKYYGYCDGAIIDSGRTIEEIERDIEKGTVTIQENLPQFLILREATNQSMILFAEKILATAPIIFLFVNTLIYPLKPL